MPTASSCRGDHPDDREFPCGRDADPSTGSTDAEIGASRGAVDIEGAFARYVSIDPWKGVGWVKVFDVRVSKSIFVACNRLPQGTRVQLRAMGCPLMFLQRDLSISEDELRRRRDQIRAWLMARFFRLNLRRDAKREFLLVGRVLAEVSLEEADASTNFPNPSDRRTGTGAL